VFGADWNDPQTFYLNLTNLARGLVVLGAVLVMTVSVISELVVRRRRTRELICYRPQLD